MYSETLLRYFREANRAGLLPPPARRVDVENPICGDILRLSLLEGEGRILDAAFQAKGCTASIAAGAALAEWAVGKSRTDLAAVTPEDVEGWLDGLPAESKHAARLAADAARAAAR